MFPPRTLDFDRFPKLDAVVLSHEHDDHFDVPSLALLDRSIPIHLSSRSSIAASQILREMGFTVHPLVPGVATKLGDLEIMPFCGDHVSTSSGDEWDTLPFLVRHTEGHGSFFSMVDIPITQMHVEWAAAKVMRPGLVGWTNNAMDWSHMADYLRERVEGTQQCFVNMGVGHKLISTIWGAPAAMMMCAGGMAFEGDRQWLNQRVFCVDTEAVCKMMGNVYKKEKFYAALPGQTFRMQGNKLKSVESSTSFLTTAPADTWPSRGKAQTEVRDFAPATGRRELPDLDRLRAALDELARSMVGGPLFKSLFSLLAPEAPDRKLTFAFVLRNDHAPIAFEYDPNACTFRDGIADERAYLAGFECWASDLLAVLSGELGPIALSFGRAKLWNALPERFTFEIFGELYRMSHPLRRPAETLRTYQRLWAGARDTKPLVAGK
ncbi:MAG: fold metallo-hydrolase [Myxococcales bacterium]|nr:fold metallo-hydrolase [Myxococcales bacterium]